MDRGGCEGDISAGGGTIAKGVKNSKQYSPISTHFLI